MALAKSDNDDEGRTRNQPRPDATRDQGIIREHSTPREREILQAASELFFERGFDGTSIGAIGKRVGISGPAIYTHFDGKDEILITLIVQGMDGLVERLGQPSDNPFADLSNLVRTHTEIVLDDRGLANVYVRESRSLGRAYQRLIDHMLEQYTERWVATLARCYPKRDRAALAGAASAAMGMTNSTVMWPEAVFATPRPELDEILVKMAKSALSVLSE